MLPIIFLLGPTAAGKTPLAIELVQQFPLEIISVDSAMIYRGLNIGTAKPSAAELAIAPHRLIDIIEPTQRYSAGRFRQDALREIAAIHAQAKIPLLVGGTMMYFQILQQGLADLPPADKAVRAELLRRAASVGWPVLHKELMQVDPLAAQRIHPHDSQRIQRALEVFMLTGNTISALQQAATHPLANYPIHALAVAPSTRQLLHARIAQRFQAMLTAGFVEEVRRLYQRGDLSLDLPSMRLVGYQQIWRYLAGEIDAQTMQQQALAATRQLAKRQLTWLRTWPQLTWLESDKEDYVAQAKSWVRNFVLKY